MGKSKNEINQIEMIQSIATLKNEYKNVDNRISEIKEEFKADISDIKSIQVEHGEDLAEIKEIVRHLNNGGMKENFSRLLNEVLEKDDKERKFELDKQKEEIEKEKQNKSFVFKNRKLIVSVVIAFFGGNGFWSFLKYLIKIFDKIGG